MRSQPIMACAARSSAPMRAQRPGRRHDQAWIRHGSANQVLQAKLRVGPADDPLEREADRVAEQVLRGDSVGPLSGIANRPQRQCVACEAEETLRRQAENEEEEEQETLRRQAENEEEEAHQLKAEAGGPRAAGAKAAAAAVAQGGRPLSPAERAYFEPRFGRDFSDVRIRLRSSAYCRPRASWTIWSSPGVVRPCTSVGRER